MSKKLISPDTIAEAVDLDRRSALSRLGLAVSAAYAAPVLMTLSQAAHAKGGSNSGPGGGGSNSGPGGGGSNSGPGGGDGSGPSASGPSASGPSGPSHVEIVSTIG